MISPNSVFLTRLWCAMLSPGMEKQPQAIRDDGKGRPDSFWALHLICPALKCVPVEGGIESEGEERQSEKEKGLVSGATEHTYTHICTPMPTNMSKYVKTTTVYKCSYIEMGFWGSPRGQTLKLGIAQF